MIVIGDCDKIFIFGKKKFCKDINKIYEEM